MTKPEDSIIREILEIIDDHCDENNVVLSFHDIGKDLQKLGLSTKKSRTEEWLRLSKTLSEEGL